MSKFVMSIIWLMWQALFQQDIYFIPLSFLHPGFSLSWTAAAEFKNELLAFTISEEMGICSRDGLIKVDN